MSKPMTQSVSQPEPKIVAECWTCLYDHAIGCRMPAACTCAQRSPIRMDSYRAAQHRKRLGHDVREVRP
jgi:hypothetical protein